MSVVIIYTSQNCPYCIAAKKLLKALNADFTEINISADGGDTHREEMIRVTGKRTVPQIIINNEPIGGFDDLSALHKSGALVPMLDNKKES